MVCLGYLDLVLGVLLCHRVSFFVNPAPFSPSRSAELTYSVWKLTVHVVGSAAEEREVDTLQCSCSSLVFLGCGGSLGSRGVMCDWESKCYTFGGL